jgi:hypothetical protein
MILGESKLLHKVLRELPDRSGTPSSIREGLRRLFKVIQIFGAMIFSFVGNRGLKALRHALIQPGSGQH